MGVKSARVQVGVVGDDLVFTHTIAKPGVTANVEGLVEVTLEVGDSAIAFYASQQPTDPSLPAVADVQSAPVAGTGAATYQFNIPAAASAKLLAALGQTVRLEVTREDETKETFYLYNEYDVLERGFPSGPRELNIP